ncbi:cardiolipin synthase [Allofranklinella schreckenbergeri]|uniref:Cardiolipin synthase n=1 Tax=Allofranklinella schreckenbergeri TaxID=1076744 RepID=A0A3M6Q5Q7_9BURK|nr:cardiolipin synthase [Allofranklinella schreckenbergeri]RMW97930.1 cardiolipin synthase [Allofranklinella schreckenbergeri]
MNLSMDYFLAAAWVLYLLVLTIWVVLQKRAPEATIGWILMLAFVPFAGFLIFYFLGPKRLRKQQRKRLRHHAKIASHDDLQALKQRAHHNPGMFRQLVQMGAATTGMYPCSAQAVDLLPSGADTFEAILEAVAQAQNHIHLEYYIYEPDQTGTRLRDALIEKARQGVQVRLLVDALGSARLRRCFIQPMLDAGIAFARFHDTRLGRRWRPMTNYRTHRKIVVCDGRIAFTGGVNITDEEDLRIRPDAYHDVHVRLVGAPAFWLQVVFLEDWAYATGTLPGDCLNGYLPISETGPHNVQIWTSGPDNPHEPIHRSYVKAISEARQRVLLTTPYFVPTEAAMMALTSAALGGVDVHVLVPQRSDSLLVTLAARSYFDELIAAGVHIWEYSDRMLHSKTLVVDDDYSFIGTANFDVRSFRLNYEVGVAVFGPQFNQALAQQFERDLKNARAVPTLRRLPFPQRLAEAATRVLSPML